LGDTAENLTLRLSDLKDFCHGFAQGNAQNFKQMNLYKTLHFYPHLPLASKN